jgi:uncharacterized protein (TIGR02001 family)
MQSYFREVSICTVMMLMASASWAQEENSLVPIAFPSEWVTAQADEPKAVTKETGDKKELVSKVETPTTLAAAPAASEAVSAPSSPHTFSSNLALYSQYIYRGLTQSNQHPAFQFGVDYSHASGVYLGAWGSTITWIRDSAAYVPNPSANVELDVYGGYKHTLESNKDLSFDLGFLRYNYFGTYPSGAGVPPTPDTNELYAAVTWKWLTAKYSYSLGKTFGVAEAKGSDYLDLTAAVPVTDDITLTLHAGHQRYKGSIDGVSNDDKFSYTDYRVELAKNLSANWQIGAGVSDTNAKSTFAGNNAYYYPTIDKNIGKATAYAFAKKTF